MLCTDTDTGLPAVRVALPLDVARDISYLLKAITDLGGNGRIQLDISGGAVVSTEVSIKRQRPASRLKPAS